MPHPRRNRPVSTAALSVGLVACALVAGASACGTTSATSSAASPAQGTTPTTAPNATPQVETSPAGDIPDNQAYVAVTGAGYRLVVPEGWARTGTAAGVTFTDKYYSIAVESSPQATAPSPSSAQADLQAIAARSRGFTSPSISTVTRVAGPVVLAKYQAQSPVNPVTGRVTEQAVERYEFWASGKMVAVTLAAPVGADNVDPWRKITDSFAWTS